MLLTRPFTFIGEKVIGWINSLGTATIFLFMALCENISAQTVFQGYSADLLYRSKIHDDYHAGQSVYRHGSGSAIIPCSG